MQHQVDRIAGRNVMQHIDEAKRIYALDRRLVTRHVAQKRRTAELDISDETLALIASRVHGGEHWRLLDRPRRLQGDRLRLFVGVSTIHHRSLSLAHMILPLRMK